jgi:hypothetical protein
MNISESNELKTLLEDIELIKDLNTKHIIKLDLKELVNYILDNYYKRD